MHQDVSEGRQVGRLSPSYARSLGRPVRKVQHPGGLFDGEPTAEERSLDGLRELAVIEVHRAGDAEEIGEILGAVAARELGEAMQLPGHLRLRPTSKNRRRDFGQEGRIREVNRTRNDRIAKAHVDGDGLWNVLHQQLHLPAHPGKIGVKPDPLMPEASRFYNQPIGNGPAQRFAQVASRLPRCRR